MKKKIALMLGMCLMAATLQIGCGGAGASKDTAAMESAPMAEAPMEEIYYADNAMGMVTSGSSAEMKGEEVMDEAAQEEEMAAESGQEQMEEVRTERKLIRTVDLNLETENYDSLMEGLEQEINRLGGYIEYKDAYHGNYYSSRNRNANITARIPANKLDEFTGKVAEIGNITYESESVEDVTLQYVDLSSHKKMLVTEQERLMELLENAESMEDIITIESRLSEVRYQIESMESQLRTFDNQVDYSTVHIFIEEVERYTPQPEETTWERIKSGFGENVYRVTNGIKNFAVEFIIAIPVLLVWAVVITVGVILVRVILKRKNKRDTVNLAKRQRLFQNKNIDKQTTVDDSNQQ